MIVLLIVIGAAALIVLCSAIDCALNIKTVNYTVPMDGIKGSVRLVCISDLHGWSYGKNNRKLLKLIAEQKPDAVLAAGDMITRRAKEKQKQRMLHVLQKLSEIAPSFYAMGNHEYDYYLKNGADWHGMAVKSGVTVLEDGYSDVKIGDDTLRIGAASGRYFDGSERDGKALNMLESIGGDGIPSIAIVHQPENIFNQERRGSWTADLYLSGHTHGGVWRIPFIGGVMSPAEGLFPQYDRGEFRIDGKMPLIISGGLSGYYFIPRVFNRPEICVIELIKKQPTLKSKSVVFAYSE